MKTHVQSQEECSCLELRGEQRGKRGQRRPFQEGLSLKFTEGMGWTSTGSFTVSVPFPFPFMNINPGEGRKIKDKSKEGLMAIEKSGGPVRCERCSEGKENYG